MHRIHHTPGFILSSASYGEANRYYKIFTRQFGLITASAQGVRFLKSKLRYGLQDYSFSDFSLVRGQELWRVTGSVKKFNIYHSLKESPEFFNIFTRSFFLLERLLAGEERSTELFSVLESAVNFVVSSKCPLSSLKNFEYLLVLRILYRLGYLGGSPDYSIFTESPYFSEKILADFGPALGGALRSINQSLKESQL